MADKTQLIDAGAFERYLMVTAPEDGVCDDCLQYVTDELMTFPTVDAVEVCCCKDCKHMEITPDELRWCNVWNGINGMGDCGYCNYGERRCE